jgi:glutamate/tyrosine decarboxylase-like PLP-dependent enzyme
MKNEKNFSGKGIPEKELDAQMLMYQSDDARLKDGRVSGFVYHPGKVNAGIAERYYTAFSQEGTLTPTLFPSLKYFEKNVIQRDVELMHVNKLTSGNITSGGTEILFWQLRWRVVLPLKRKGGSAPLGSDRTGISSILKNRHNVNKITENLLDGLFS